MTEHPNPEVLSRRIAALLAKAEGTTNEHEADAFMAKAYELADKYRIDVATLRKEKGMVGRTTYTLAGTKYLRASLNLLVAVCKHYGVVVLVRATGNSKYPTLVGDPDDARMAVTMFHSLLLQRDRFCLRDVVPYGENVNRHRNSFALGYAWRIAKRLEELRAAAAAQAAADTNDMALEVYGRYDQVMELLDNPADRTTNKPDLSQEGVEAGDAAGRRADLGQSRVGDGAGVRAIGPGA